MQTNTQYRGKRSRPTIAFIVTLAMIVTMIGGYGGGTVSAANEGYLPAADIVNLVKQLNEVKPGQTVEITGDIIPTTTALSLTKGAMLVFGNAKATANYRLDLASSSSLKLNGNVTIGKQGILDWSGVVTKAAAVAPANVTIASTASITVDGGTLKLPGYDENPLFIYPEDGTKLIYKSGITAGLDVRVDYSLDPDSKKDGRVELSQYPISQDSNEPYFIFTNSELFASPARVVTINKEKTVVASVKSRVSGSESATVNLDEAIYDSAYHIKARNEISTPGSFTNATVEVDATNGSAKGITLNVATTAAIADLETATAGKNLRFLIKTDLGDIELTGTAIGIIKNASPDKNNPVKISIKPGELYESQTQYTKALDISIAKNGTGLSFTTESVAIALKYDYGKPENAKTVKLWKNLNSSTSAGSNALATMSAIVTDKAIGFMTKLDAADPVNRYGITQDFTVTFDNQPSPDPQISPAAVQIPYNETFSTAHKDNLFGGKTFPANPTAPTGTVFTKWLDSLPGGQELTATTKITKDIEAKAVFDSILNDVTFKNEAAADVVKSIAYGSKLGDSGLPPAVSPRAGFTFGGWFTGLNGTGTQVTAETVITAPVTYYAYWIAGYTVKFNDGAKTLSSKVYNANSTLGTLPTPSKAGYKFEGWFTALPGGTKVTSATVVTGNVTYYAHWTALKYKIVLKDGSKTKKTYANKAYGAKVKLTVKPTKKNYKFKGWYTKKKGGKKVTTATVTKNVTYYAHWARLYKAKSTVKLYKSKKTSSKVLKTVKKGKKVEYVGKSGSWYKVKYGGKTGYIQKKYLKK
ncbi:MAG: InlB B-repeat-containing protein [Clostridiales Family XIII bacterium]|jgi:uncharacterized repeat protein (TIGR02543 family)|nr:InlB B-repeat-containing protein [Clostridiales Family XIII bacterium]